MQIALFIICLVFICPSSSLIRKFSQQQFDQWIDESNFLVVLFCASDDDKTSIKEKEKLSQLSKDLSEHKDIIFGYISKASDAILHSRYDIVKLPMVKLFPYIQKIQNYPMNIRNKDLEKFILDTRKSALKNKKVPEKTPSKKVKKSNIKEIDWVDMASTVQKPSTHAMLILYETNCGIPCQILERVANIFVNDDQIEFYKMHADKGDILKKTTPFQSSPMVFWFPTSNKDRGFVYAGQILFEVLVEFVNDRAGLSRDYSGQLKHNAGRIIEIDSIIKENILEILVKTKVDYVIFLVEEKAQQLPHAKKYIDYYLAVLKEIKNSDSPEQILNQEIKFIEDMMEKKSLNAVELDDWKKFYNIISAFIEFAAAKLSETVTRTPAELKEDISIKKDSRFSRHEEL